MPSKSPTPFDRKLVSRLPRTFTPILNDYFDSWDELFPAEQRPISLTMSHLASLPDEELQALLGPIRQLEGRMKLPEWTPSSDRLSIEEASMLARSPHYQEWRNEVSKFFENVNEAVRKSGRDLPSVSNKFVLNVMPAGLPIDSQPLWPRRSKDGHWIQLEEPFGKSMAELVSNLHQRTAPAGVESIEHTWILEGAGHYDTKEAPENFTVLSYDELRPIREAFCLRMDDIEKNLRSADATYEDLRRADISGMLGPRLSADLRIREFTRMLFLSGNGAVIFNNSFVQWGATEALRRAQPQALISSFGIRQKLKPFSSLVLFRDQSRANPVPDALDPEGSLIDIQLLCDYVYLAADRESNYRTRTAFLFAAAESPMLLLVAPSGFPTLPSSLAGPLSFSQLNGAILDWLA